MNYSNFATSRTPAFIIYLIDVSGSMGSEMPGTGKRKIDFVSYLLEEVAYQIYLRSRRGTVVAERYRLAVFAYNQGVVDVTNNEFISVKEFVQGIPEFGDLGNAPTNTFAGMSKVYDLLKKTVHKIDSSYPAPLVCHLTDGEYTSDFGNPSSLMKEIMNMETPDGKVLLENVYLGKNFSTESTKEYKPWLNTSHTSVVEDTYARFLQDHSSALPQSFIKYFNSEYRFNYSPGSKMFFSAENVETVKRAFTISFTPSPSTPRGHIENLQVPESNLPESTQNGFLPAEQNKPIYDLSKLIFGSDDAELDEKNGFLSRVFLKTSIYTRVMKSQRELVVGRKGTGKSAICLMLRNALELEGVNTLLITPKYLSSTKIEDSRVSSVNQDELYFLLWKYTLLISVGRKIYDNATQSSRKVYKKIKKNIKVVRSFLADNDELEKTFMDKISGKSNIFSKFTVKAFGIEGSAETKQLQAQKDFAAELDKFQENLKIIVTELKFNNFVVLIDKVDDVWTQAIESELMITGLIKSVHELNVSISGVHFILFLRSDIYDNVIRFNDADKLHSVEERIGWNRDDLKHLLANRGKVSLGLETDDINEIWKMLFDEKVNGAFSFDYMIDKTLCRPRDIIQFCNEALSCAQDSNHHFITSDDILLAERQYSSWKMKDAISEFSVQYPFLKDVFGVLQGYKEKFTLPEFENRINTFFAKGAKDTEIKKMPVENLAQVLFDIGIFGVTINNAPVYFYDDNFFVLSSGSTLIVHPAYHFALGYKSIAKI